MFKKVISFLVLSTFLCVSVIPAEAQSIFQSQSVFSHPGTTKPYSGSSILDLSELYQPSLLSGIKIFPKEPFRFDFLMTEGDSNLSSSGLTRGPSLDPRLHGNNNIEVMKLIRYFLAALTVPEGDLWVNLSPHEPDRIIPDALGQTQMGHDLLAQDYMLKKLTASLMHPDGETGRKFWDRIYSRVYSDKVIRGKSDRDRANITSITDHSITIEKLPELFNKIWIVPDKVEVYQNNDVAYITSAKLKVMTESDYVDEVAGRRLLVASDESRNQQPGTSNSAKETMKNILLPIIEHEVNHGKHFALLRQIFHSMILAKWYESHFKNSIIGQAYVDRNKVSSLSSSGLTRGSSLDSRLRGNDNSRQTIDQIYQSYLDLFKTGVTDVIREEYDPVEQKLVTRKYFTGGFQAKFDSAQMTLPNQALNIKNIDLASLQSVSVVLETKNSNDQAMLDQEDTISLHEFFKKIENSYHFFGKLEPDYRQEFSDFVKKFIGPVDKLNSDEKILKQNLENLLRKVRLEGHDFMTMGIERINYFSDYIQRLIVYLERKIISTQLSKKIGEIYFSKLSEIFFSSHSIENFVNFIDFLDESIEAKKFFQYLNEQKEIDKEKLFLLIDQIIYLSTYRIVKNKEASYRMYLGKDISSPKKAHTIITNVDKLTESFDILKDFFAEQGFSVTDYDKNVDNLIKVFSYFFSFFSEKDQYINDFLNFVKNEFKDKKFIDLSQSLEKIALFKSSKHFNLVRLAFQKYYSNPNMDQLLKLTEIFEKEAYFFDRQFQITQWAAHKLEQAETLEDYLIFLRKYYLTYDAFKKILQKEGRSLDVFYYLPSIFMKALLEAEKSDEYNLLLKKYLESQNHLNALNKEKMADTIFWRILDQNLKSAKTVDEYLAILKKFFEAKPEITRQSKILYILQSMKLYQKGETLYEKNVSNFSLDTSDFKILEKFFKGFPKGGGKIHLKKENSYDYADFERNLYRFLLTFRDGAWYESRTTHENKLKYFEIYLPVIRGGLYLTEVVMNIINDYRSSVESTSIDTDLKKMLALVQWSFQDDKLLRKYFSNQGVDFEETSKRLVLAQMISNSFEFEFITDLNDQVETHNLLVEGKVLDDEKGDPLLLDKPEYKSRTDIWQLFHVYLGNDEKSKRYDQRFITSSKRMFWFVRALLGRLRVDKGRESTGMDRKLQDLMVHFDQVVKDVLVGMEVYEAFTTSWEKGNWNKNKKMLNDINQKKLEKLSSAEILNFFGQYEDIRLTILDGLIDDQLADVVDSNSLEYLKKNHLQTWFRMYESQLKDEKTQLSYSDLMDFIMDVFWHEMQFIVVRGHAVELYETGSLEEIIPKIKVIINYLEISEVFRDVYLNTIVKDLRLAEKQIDELLKSFDSAMLDMNLDLDSEPKLKDVILMNAEFFDVDSIFEELKLSHFDFVLIKDDYGNQWIKDRNDQVILGFKNRSHSTLNYFYELTTDLTQRELEKTMPEKVKFYGFDNLVKWLHLDIIYEKEIIDGEVFYIKKRYQDKDLTYHLANKNEEVGMDELYVFNVSTHSDVKLTSPEDCLKTCPGIFVEAERNGDLYHGAAHIGVRGFHSRKSLLEHILSVDQKLKDEGFYQSISYVVDYRPDIYFHQFGKDPYQWEHEISKSKELEGIKIKFVRRRTHENHHFKVDAKGVSIFTQGHHLIHTMSFDGLSSGEQEDSAQLDINEVELIQLKGGFGSYESQVEQLIKKNFPDKEDDYAAWFLSLRSRLFGLILLAVYQGQLVGFLSGGELRWWEHRVAHNYFFGFSVFHIAVGAVSKQHQGQKIYTALFRQMVRVLKSKNYDQLTYRTSNQYLIKQREKYDAQLRFTDANDKDRGFYSIDLENIEFDDEAMLFGLNIFHFQGSFSEKDARRSFIDKVLIERLQMFSTDKNFFKRNLKTEFIAEDASESTMKVILFSFLNSKYLAIFDSEYEVNQVVAYSEVWFDQNSRTMGASGIGTETLAKSRSYMQRGIEILLKSRFIHSWSSSFVRSGTANKMYGKIKKDSNFAMSENKDGNGNVQFRIGLNEEHDSAQLDRNKNQESVGGIDLNNLSIESDGAMMDVSFDSAQEALDPALMNTSTGLSDQNNIPFLMPKILSISKFEDKSQLAEFLNLDINQEKQKNDSSDHRGQIVVYRNKHAKIIS